MKKRKSTKDFVEHINYGLVAKPHISMYLMHKYWARKPHNVVAEYIEHYSKEGDVVLDPFCGSGVTAIEALKLGRKAVAVDIDPLAIFIAKCTAMPVDLTSLENEFGRIEKKLRDKIYSLYATKCPLCKGKAVTEAVIWENETPKEIRYSCSCKKGSLWKAVGKADKELIGKVNDRRIKYWYPQNELIWNTRVNVRKGTKVSDIFTKRNLLALAMMLDEINNVSDKNIKEILRFTFSSALPQASKMVFVYRIAGREKQVGGWATRGYWVPPEYFEINAWNCFEERFKKIYRGKEESNSLIALYKEAKNFEELDNEANILFLNQSTLNLSNIPNDSIDYIFTDPPYGDSVPYLELDLMWDSWLGFESKISIEDEIIISDSPVRMKTFEIYDKMLKAAFRQIYKVLKSGRWMTVTFHNTDIKVWNSIISAVAFAGFDLDKIIYQPPARASAKGLLHPYASAVGDYYIRFLKAKTIKARTTEELTDKRYERIVVEAAKRIIAERGEPTIYQHILNGIIVELKKEGALLSAKINPDNIMKAHLDKEFVLIDIKDDKARVIGQKWWFKEPNTVPYLELIPLSDRVETTVIDVLHRKVKVSFDDILQDLFISFPNALTPDTQNIKDLLEEYAMPTKDGKWMLKPVIKTQESQHSVLIGYLALLGKKAGFDIWIGQKEQADDFKGTRLSELCTTLHPRFRFIPTTNLDRVKQIDVIWYEDGRIKYEFEVEHTTAITEAIVRGSNIPHDAIKRYLIIPSERERLLFRKMQEPILSENIQKYGWKFIFYQDIEELFMANKNKKKINLEGFDAISKQLKANNPAFQLNLLGKTGE
jgi:16S rRNA G966 N2-methylase RsmD